MRKLLFFSLLALLGACGSSEEPVSELPTLSITSCLVKENEVLAENFSSPIGLYLLDQNSLPYDPEVPMNSASIVHGNWLLDRDVYVAGKGAVYAYYPYSSTDVLPLLTVDMTNQVDILYTKIPSTIDVENFALSFELSHALSQVVVSVEGEDIKSLSLLSSPLSGKFNITTGQFEVLSNGVVSGTSDKLLLIPHTCFAELKITLLSGVEYIYAIDSQDYAAGENYTYEFKLNANREKLEVLSVTVTDWISNSNFQDYLK